jgi:hypothetical protein
MAAFGTLETVRDYVSDVRTLLQDTVRPHRYSDESILAALNVTLLEARRLRADLFIFRNGGRVPMFMDINDNRLEMEEPFRLAIVHGIVAHALSRDQEDIQDNRAASFMGVFNAMLIGVASPGIATGTHPPAQGGHP